MMKGMFSSLIPVNNKTKEDKRIHLDCWSFPVCEDIPNGCFYINDIIRNQSKGKKSNESKHSVGNTRGRSFGGFHGTCE